MMEAFAIGYVGDTLPQRAIVAKAVSDHADHDKDDRFREFACRASAAWLFAFLKEHVTPGPPPHARRDLRRRAIRGRGRRFAIWPRAGSRSRGGKSTSRIRPASKLALARGMQGFQISAARNINTALGIDRYRRRRGPVFADRYHLEVITSPKRARHALSYVLNNWRKHREDQQGLASTWLVDLFSTGILFPDWQELEDKALMWSIRETYDPLVVYRPQTWLLREGWKLHGSVSARDVPSQRS